MQKPEGTRGLRVFSATRNWVLRALGSLCGVLGCALTWSGLCHQALQNELEVFKSGFIQPIVQTFCAFLGLCQFTRSLFPRLSSCLFQTCTIFPSPIFSLCLVFLWEDALASFTCIWASQVWAPQLLTFKADSFALFRVWSVWANHPLIQGKHLELQPENCGLRGMGGCCHFQPF